MKLHHSAVNGKNSFAKSCCFSSQLEDSRYSQGYTDQSGTHFADFFSNTNSNTDSLRNNHPFGIDPSEEGLIQLYNQFGNCGLHDFSRGNICIIGDDLRVVESFSNWLLSKLDYAVYPSGVYRGENMSLESLNGMDERYVTKVSGMVTRSLMNSAIKSSNTICVLPLTKPRIKCSANGTARLDHFIERVVARLGGDRDLRRSMITSLGEEEFMLIENAYYYPAGGTESIRRFETNAREPEDHTGAILTRLGEMTDSLKDIELMLQQKRRGQ